MWFIAGIMNNEQAGLIHQMSLGTTTPVIVIALGSPYTLRGCPDCLRVSRCLRYPRRLSIRSR